MKNSRLNMMMLAKASLMVMASALYAPVAQADSAPASPKADAQLSDILVTATRREEKLKDVPVSATVITESALSSLAAFGQDIRMLSGKVPSLNIESSLGRIFPRFYIRGYGNTDFGVFASQPVSLVYDDVVQENAELKGFPAFDMADVEVLRGPQGTLFGRNSPAGVIKFESAKPNFNGESGYFNISDGTYNTLNTEGAINIPISEKFAARISIEQQHRDNWVNDPINNTKLEGYEDAAFRAQLLYRPDPNFSALFNVHGRTLQGTSRIFRANIIVKGTNELVPDFNPAYYPSDGANSQSFGSIGGNARLQWTIDNYKIFSITGYETILHAFNRGDIDGGYGAAGGTQVYSTGQTSGPGFIPFASETGGAIKDHGQFTQEFRVESDYSGSFNWQAGAFGFYDHLQNPKYNYNGLTNIQNGFALFHQENNSEAAFASFEYHLVPKLKLSGGVRYTNDHKKFEVLTSSGVSLVTAPPTASSRAGRVNWDASALYTATDNLNFYTRIATGFRAPSFGYPSAGQAIQVAVSEDVTSYEGGFKAALFDHHASIDFDVFDYEVRNQQLTAVGGASNITTLLNARHSSGRGAEIDLQLRPVEHLTITGGGSYNYTILKDNSIAVGKCAACTILNPINAQGKVVINGNPLPMAPRWIANATLRYGVPIGQGEAYFYTDWSYRGTEDFFLYRAKEFTGQALIEGGLRAGYSWTNGKYDVAVFCRNCTNRIVAIGAIDFDNLTGMINDPRIIGVQFSTKF